MDQASHQRLVEENASRYQTNRSARASKRAKVKEAKEETEAKTKKQTGTTSAPDDDGGKTLTTKSIKKGQPSQTPEHHPSPQLPAVREKGKNILAPLFEYFHHNNGGAGEQSGDDLTPFTPGGDDEEDFDEIMEQWMEEEEAVKK